MISPFNSALVSPFITSACYQLGLGPEPHLAMADAPAKSPSPKQSPKTPRSPAKQLTEPRGTIQVVCANSHLPTTLNLPGRNSAGLKRPRFNRIPTFAMTMPNRRSVAQGMAFPLFFVLRAPN